MLFCIVATLVFLSSSSCSEQTWSAEMSFNKDYTFPPKNLTQRIQYSYVVGPHVIPQQTEYVLSVEGMGYDYLNGRQSVQFFEQKQIGYKKKSTLVQTFNNFGCLSYRTAVSPIKEDENEAYMFFKVMMKCRGDNGRIFFWGKTIAKLFFRK